MNTFEQTEFEQPQDLRRAAMKWQLLALVAQAQAVETIAKEHNIVFDHCSPQMLAQRADDLVKTANDIAVAAKSNDVQVTLASIKALRANSDHLKRDTDAFVKTADLQATFRLSSTLALLFDAGERPTSGGTDPEERLIQDPQKLLCHAGKRCLSAETEQHGTFALQIKAICDLAMETVLVAAAESAPKNI